jgi:hypothetical protein
MKQTFTFSLRFLLVAAIVSSCHYDNTVLPENPGTSSGPSAVWIKSNVKIAIGGVLYENLDALIRVKGYDAANKVLWSQDYSFTGPADNVWSVKNGLDNYSIELMNKWGIHDIQSGITASQLWDGRADGPQPVTYVLGGSKLAKKLSMYTVSRQVASSPQITFEPESRAKFVYDSNGQLQSIHYETYNSQTLKFEETSVDTFTYSGNAVSSIVNTLEGNLYTESHYEYGTQNIIRQKLYYNNNLEWTLTSSRNEDNNSVHALYSLSNGNSFTYDFNFSFKNQAKDVTIQSGEVCNEGNYTYDKNINPFRHLGYLDFNFRNWSANNRLTENVIYKACGFPTVQPFAYEYVYDEDGYPVQKITNCKNGSFGSVENIVSYRTKTEFVYQ